MKIAEIRKRIKREIPMYKEHRSAPTYEIECEWCGTKFRAAIPLGVLIRIAGWIIEGTRNDGRFICDWCESRPGPPTLGSEGWL